MKIKSQPLYFLYLIIIGTSPLSLSMNIHYLKALILDKINIATSDETVDSIINTPQMNQKKRDSQLTKVINETRVNIAIMNNKAYWIRNNTVFSSKLDEEGNVDIANAEKVDVFSLSEKEMKTLMSIIDSLNK